MLAKPTYKFTDASLKRCGGRVIEQTTSFVDIRVCVRHVSVLHRSLDDLCFFAERLLDCIDHLEQRDWIRSSKIDYLEARWLQFDGAGDSGYDIQHESVVAFCAAVAIKFYRLTIFNELAKFADCEIWALSGSKDCERSNANYI